MESTHFFGYQKVASLRGKEDLSTLPICSATRQPSADRSKKHKFIPISYASPGLMPSSKCNTSGLFAYAKLSQICEHDLGPRLMVGLDLPRWVSSTPIDRLLCTRRGAE